ncbi:hypothetical protein [Candidatus Ruminimicrobium bovinum]|uniref:hypothetical protein n=1 Tax=Candidatus Ruminimicrobium bovinum TaxID=3242779 RepID=UPI0039B833DD
MNIKDLLKGIIVVIDDQVNTGNSSIKSIVEQLRKDNFPVVTYTDIPNINIIESLSYASVIILDWDFNNIDNVIDDNDMTVEERRFLKRAMDKSEPNKEKKIELINFLTETLGKIFVPIFIFTDQVIDSIKREISDAHLGSHIDKRIFIKAKDYLIGEHLYTEIDNWLKCNNVAYIVKEWDKIAVRNRNKMFLELYNCKADWVSILWKVLSDDTSSLNTHNDLGDFITKNFYNRFHSYKFDENYISIQKNSKNIKEIFTILKHDAFIEYTENNKPDIPYTGDIFKKNGEYFLNLRAQCDISRKDTSGSFNPNLYCIKGKAVSDEKVIKNYINLKKENDQLKIILGNNEPVLIDKDCNYEQINKEIQKCINNNFLFKYGALLENKDTILFPYVIENKIINFKINKIEVKQFDSIKDKRIGRIVSPYLTRIQQKTANYIIRQGIMPIPEELFF